MPAPVQLPTRRLGKTGPTVPAIGFGLMGLSTAYGTPLPQEERLAVLDRAWAIGCTHWDTADFYGDNEELVGEWFRRHPERRADIVLASKFGLGFGVRPDTQAPGIVVDSSPDNCRARCAASLQRLGVDRIDLYYVHRVDGKTPIEHTMRALAALQAEGAIGHIGLSAPSSATLRRAVAVAPVAAVQVEYSIFSRTIEQAAGTHLRDTCRALGVATVAYAPVGRGFLTGRIRSPDGLGPADLRRKVPRFDKGAPFDKNLALVDTLAALAAARDPPCTPSQLALAWLLAQGDDIVPIPGTKHIAFLEENVAAVHVRLTADEEAAIRRVVEEGGVAGEEMAPGVLEDYGDTPEEAAA